ncbi:hypothetical protein WMY93_007405 [Mugilogobius chulae]|uniref:Uncharacterized protein n=1 Tax=Mugilogobius chulae TaxID=88201 RepID=A0AAW0PLS3_9GOBI
MEDEMKKKTPNGRLIKPNMDLTFALRRIEVVEKTPPISLLMKRWPALFSNEQICLEFKRIVGKDLQQEFYSALDTPHYPSFGNFQSEEGQRGRTSMDPTEKRTVALRGLPYLLGDNPTEFFKSSFDGDESFGQIDVGILLVNPEGVSPPTADLHPASLKIVLEGEVVVDKLKTLPDAVCLLFGLTYGLHLNYPKKIQNTLQFIQQSQFVGATLDRAMRVDIPSECRSVVGVQYD